jgi:hypothetical protein
VRLVSSRTEVVRFTVTAHRTSESLARSIARKKQPKPTAEMRAKPAPFDMAGDVFASSVASLDASTTPAIAMATPIACRVLGRSPVAIPTATGITAAVEESGATTPIAPIDSAL